MDCRLLLEIRLDVQVNNATLLHEAHQILARTPIESIIVRFSHRQAFDFGAWCFAKRFGGRARKKVDSSARLPKRLDRLEKLASYVITVSLTKKTLASAFTFVSDWVLMAKWCETNGLESFLDSAEEHRQALVKFTEHLNGDHREYQTRQRMQLACKTSGEHMFPEGSELFSNLPAIMRPPQKAKKIAEPPTRDAITHHLRTCEPLFVGLTDLLTHKTELPFKLEINGDFAWIMPDKKYPLITSKILAKAGAHSADSVTIDFSKGRMRTFEEFKTRSKEGCQKNYAKAIKAYARRLSEANATTDNEYRVRLGRFAHDSFVAMFVLNTGINESPLREIPWDAKYEISKDDEIGMRSIKFRANNKVIAVRVKAAFIKHFKKFVELRSYLCDGREHPYLFIGFDGNRNSNYRIMDTNILRRLHATLQRLVDPNIPCLSFHNFRDYKDNYTAKNHGHEASRIILGHSERTQRKNYLKSNEHSAVDQIGRFNAVVNEFFTTPHACTTPVGGCEQEGSPQKTNNSNTTSEPNCKNEAGCLNCVHHKVHATQDDAWKLLSFEYVTKQMIQASSSAEHFELIHTPTLQHIEGLLNKILAVNPSLGPKLEELRFNVYENNSLTPYWQRHLERLVRLKVIS